DVVWLANDFGACSPELLKVPLYVLALDVEDEPAWRRVLALDLVVGADRYPSASDLPAVIAPLRHGGLAEDLCVVIGEPLGILRSDHDAVEVHRYLPLGFSAAGPAPASNCWGSHHDSHLHHHRGGRKTVNAPASITITPVRVADL